MPQALAPQGYKTFLRPFRRPTLQLCAVYPRAIGDKVALSKALEAINALKGCKHLNPDQKQYLDNISNRVYRYERDCRRL